MKEVGEFLGVLFLLRGMVVYGNVCGCIIGYLIVNLVFLDCIYMLVDGVYVVDVEI